MASQESREVTVTQKSGLQPAMRYARITLNDHSTCVFITYYCIISTSPRSLATCIISTSLRSQSKYWINIPHCITLYSIYYHAPLIQLLYILSLTVDPSTV